MPEAVQDYLLDDDFDLAPAKNGDFAIGDSDEQHIQLILFSKPGDWRQYLRLGVFIHQYLKAPESVRIGFERNMRVQLKSDNYNVQQLDLSNGIKKFKLKGQRLR